MFAIFRWLKNRLWPQLLESYNNWTIDDGHLMASALAYYAALSLFPLLLILISSLGLFFQFTNMGQDAEQQVLAVIAEHTSPALQEQIAQALNQVQQQAATTGPLGFLILFFTAAAIFVQFETTFDRIWNIPEKERGFLATLKSLLFYRLRAFLMLMVMGLLTLCTFIVLMLLTTTQELLDEAFPIHQTVWGIVEFSTGFVLNTAIFTLIFRLLPKVPVKWSEAIQGGILTGIVWEIGRQLLSAFVIGGRYSSAYGVIGSFIAIMFWAYIASAVLFYGAEYVQVLRQHRANNSSPPASKAKKPAS